VSNNTRSDEVKIWEVSSGKEIATIKGRKYSRYSLSFSPDGRYMALCNIREKTIKILEVSSGKEIALLKGHEGGISSVSFSPDGKYLASGGEPIKIWEISSGKEIAILRSNKDRIVSLHLKFSPDGRYLASGHVNETVIWEVSSGKEIAALKEHEHYGVKLISVQMEDIWYLGALLSQLEFGKFPVEKRLLMLAALKIGLNH